VGVDQQPSNSEILDNFQARYDVGVSLEVDNIDLVERLKKELKSSPNQKPKSLARALEVTRKVVTRTLHSYQNIFIKNDLSEWYVKPDYAGNTTEADVNFRDINLSPETKAPVPVIGFKEQDKPPQRAVIEAKLDKNLLVLAPPGTGKTHTLVERLVFAINISYREVDPGELLVLSFTRAAVGEIRERIAKAIANGAPNSLRYVQVRTFDAYATWLLNDGGYDIAGKTYDSRIELLTKALNTVSLRQTTDRIGRSRYLFVDEIQDLVGVRADMVFELVKRILISKGSVTLLGDPHQSLNDYQIKGSQTDSAEFLKKVQNYLAGGLERFELEESRRYETPEMKRLAANTKELLDSTVLTAAEKYKALGDIMPIFSVEKFIERLGAKKIDAILCRTNKEVFQWVNWLNDNDYYCSVNHGSQGRPWPAWIGSGLMKYKSDVISLERFTSRIRLAFHGEINVREEEIESFLIDEKLVHNNRINVHDLSFRLMNFSPASKGQEKGPGLVVSTIHKAKGLEYPEVVVVEPYTQEIDGSDVRVLYVAITRAKKRIAIIKKENMPFDDRLKSLKRSRLKPKRCQYRQGESKFFQVIGIDDFDIQNLFILSSGDIDEVSLEAYLASYQKKCRYSIAPENCHEENDHDYALYLNYVGERIRLCAAGEDLKSCLDSMSFGNKYGEDGALLDMGNGCNYQTIVHPMQSPILARHIGPAGIMVFPLIQGFYPLSRATGE